MTPSGRAIGLMLTVMSAWVALGSQSYRVSTLEDAFQKELDRLAGLYRFPGATAAFVLPEGEHRGFATGYADRERQSAMQPDHVQPVGGLGKSFTAALMLTLSDDGTLKLDDKIAKWLGREPWFPLLPNRRDVTVRMLLNHSSGIPDHFQDRRFVKEMRSRVRQDRDFRYPPEQLVRMVLDKDALFAPGKRFAYSETNHVLAILVIERATGSSYQVLLVERLLGPLRLALTGPVERRALPGLAPGYIGAWNPFRLPRKTVEEGMLAIHPMNQGAGGSIISNSRDLARWAKALYEGNALAKPYLEDLLSSVGPDRTGQRYGLGVDIEKSDLGPIYGHEGWFPGYRTKMAYFPDHKIAVAMQINSDVDIDMRRCALSLAGVLVRRAPHFRR